MKIGQEAFYGLWAEQGIGLARDRSEKMPLDFDKVGQLLRTAREEKGLTFQEISDALFIGKKVLRAIESGDRDALPPMVYVKGYVTQYASFLNILDVVRSELS
jgi:ribosome-binding protein aMBF1 (putative translation factor)